MGIYSINFSLTWELGRSLQSGFAVSFENTAHTSHTLLLPALLLSYSPYYHKSTQLSKTNGLFGVLNLILVPRKDFCFREWIRSNAPPITCVLINTGRHTQSSSFSQVRKRHRASLWQLILQRTEQLSNHQGCDYILKSHSDSHWDLSEWGSGGV